jgi:hypothetical protein
MVWSVERINTLNQERHTGTYNCKMKIRKLLDQETGEQALRDCSPAIIFIRWDSER